jgi:hypothetical protein
MAILVSYNTDNCPTENSKMGKCQKNIYQRNYQARLFWQKDSSRFLPQVTKFLQQRILCKRLNI